MSEDFDEDELELNIPISTCLNDLDKVISVKESFRRVGWKLPFILAPGLEIGVRG